MALNVDVPLNTAIADLDEALRDLLKRELGKHGFEGVDVAFDAPSRDWSGKLTNPTVNMFLYDLREAADPAGGTSTEVRGNGGAYTKPTPMRLELTYAVTGWTKAVEDEHRLLSQVLSVFFSYRPIPVDVLTPHLGEGTKVGAIETSVGRPREDKADFWTAVGGQYKASIDYVVRMTVESGAVFERGPEVRSQTLRTRILDGPRSTLSEFTRLGGTIKTGDGTPVANAFVSIPEAGVWTASNREGRFIFDRIVPGEHRVLARTAAGDEAELTATVPGTPVDLVMGAKAKPKGKGAK